LRLWNGAVYSSAMTEDRTTVVVQQYLNDLAAVHGQTSAQPIIGALLGRSAKRLHLLCATMLLRSYPRLMRAPLNLQTDEMLSAVVERLLKAMREVHPTTVRQFFALANQHLRWELNDVARRLDNRALMVELHESAVPAPAASTEPQATPNFHRMLEAIEGLPDDEREVFSLVRIQAMAQTEAAEVLGVSVKTVQRRLNRSLVLLATKLGDLQPAAAPVVQG